MKDIIIACDFGDKTELTAFLGQFREEKPFLKIGMELFYGEGPDIVRMVKGMGFPVFLDLKLHDIPNTVRKAMRNLARLGADMVNVHAAGTIAMMKAAREGLSEGAAAGARTALIAVTQLTSTSGEALRHELLIETDMAETVTQYAMNAKDAGLDGVVCSPLEVRMVKAACGDAFWAVTPGIRYPESGKDDQARVATPETARELGADFIVVGRPITAAADPVAAYRRARKEFVG